MKLAQKLSLGAMLLTTVVWTSGCMKEIERLTANTVDATNRIESKTAETVVETKQVNAKLKVSNDGIVKTAELLEATIDLQTFGSALLIFQNPEADTNFRAASALVVIIKTLDQSMLMANVAAEFPVEYSHYKKIPNVTQVDDSKDVKLEAGLTMKPNTAKVLLIGCELAGPYFMKKITTGKLNKLEEEQLHTQAMNYFLGCSAVAGAKAARKNGSWAELVPGSPFEKTLKDVRNRIAADMEKISNTSYFTDTERLRVKEFVKIRMTDFKAEEIPESPQHLPVLENHNL